MSLIFHITPKKYTNCDKIELLDLPPLIVHPSTASLAKDLLVDPEAYQQNYNGIYDESGDYVPQYCDDPELIPRSVAESLAPNKESAPVNEGGETPPTSIDTSDNAN